MESQVTVLGLGRMGSALARAFNEKGYKTVGWSRSEGRRNAAAAFCEPALSAAAAVAASPLIVSCLTDYAATMDVISIISSNDWRSRTLVQLASGGPADAVAMEKWSASQGVRYLDGAIGTSPIRIGHARTAIFLSGDAQAYRQYSDVLSALGGNVKFVGESVAAAATFDVAWLSMYYGLSVGMLNAATICETANISLANFFECMGSFMSEMTHVADEYTEMISNNQFAGGEATIDVHYAAIEHLAASTRSSKLDTRFPDLLLSIFGDAKRRGLGALEIAAGVQVLRNPTKN